MALARKKAERSSTTPAEVSLAEQLARATRLMALLLVKGEPQPEKIRILRSAGFANTEIAELLGITANTVNVALYKQRTKK